MMNFFRLFIITSLVCGLEFCTASAFTYIPPILLKAGISESLMTWLMGCGPLLVFFFVLLLVMQVIVVDLVMVNDVHLFLDFV